MQLDPLLVEPLVNLTLRKYVKNRMAIPHHRLRRTLRALFRQTDLRLLLMLLSVVLSIWIFVAIADAVGAGATQALDNAIVRALYESSDEGSGRSIALRDMTRDITALGSMPVLTFVSVAVAGFLALSRLYRALVLVLVTALGGTAWTFALKVFFSRERPRFSVDSVVSTMSFPSGHSALSAVIYLTLAALLARLVERRALRAYIIGVAALATGLVGVSRIALGVHYPTDVLAGWTLGLGWAVFCWAAMTLLQRRGAVESMEEAHHRPEAAHTSISDEP
jgi:undecaprenyl-diphosphatase